MRPDRVKGGMLLRASLAALGVLMCLVGVVFIGQGVNVIHGSSMSGHRGYAALGAVLLVVGLALVAWAWRRGGTRAG
jgi:protein-S-isoprenylcysteine O-methyltransferase Ste14